MNMATDENRRDTRRQVLLTLGGLGIGLAVAALIGLFINDVIEPTMQTETQGLVQFAGERFSIWYSEESMHKNTRRTLLPRLEEALDDLLERLDVSIDAIPLPIDVLVHDTPEMMQLTTMRRKSISAMYSFYAMIDVLYNEDPYPRLAELVLAFGWGRCYSQLLYKGMLTTVLFPERDFHVALAAAPERILYSFDELLLLEQAGAFGETLYQRYQSPFSSRLVLGSLEGIGEFRSMLSDVSDESADYDLAHLQAASLVQYLIEHAGMDAFRAAWGPGTTEALVLRLAASPLPELFEDWRARMRSADTASEEYNYYLARFLFESGDLAAAARVTEAWNPSGLSAARSLLGVRTQLAAADFVVARRFATSAAPSISSTLTGWVDAYAGCRQATDGFVTVLVSGSDVPVDEWLDRARTSYASAVRALGFREDELPEHITVFIYGTDDERDGGRQMLPAIDIHRTLWHVSVQDDLLREFVGTLPSFVVKKDTASNLLRRGLTAALCIDRQTLIDQGCEMVREAQWTSLARIGLGGVPDRLLDVQTGLMVWYVMDTYGVEAIRGLWAATARIGGGVSLDTALKNALNTSRSEIEAILLESILVCE
jgi:hypothetical protein